MHMLHKLGAKAKTSPSEHSENSDNNEPNKTSVENDSDNGIENVEYVAVEDQVNEYLLKMENFLRELVIFCFIFVAYAAITNDPPKVSKAPATYPFFPKNSIVKDFYRGEILEAIKQTRSSDFSFLMFYAPWDAESQAARKDFQATAHYLRDNVVFAAVNCWQPGSQCRNQYNKVYRWPVLIAYPAFGTGIQYNGPLEKTSMISFLKKLMKPIKRAPPELILDFEEAFIIAEINASLGSVEYSTYYTTALKYLENDPFGRVSFYVKPVKMTKNKLKLYLWNQVRILDIEVGSWKVDTILQWLLENIITPSSWVVPTGSKSLLLSSHLQPGPTLILFTPNNPLYGTSDYYMMFQQITQEYKNCDNEIPFFDMDTKRLKNLLEYKYLRKICHTKKPVPKIKAPITANYGLVNGTKSIIKYFQQTNIHLDQNNNEDCYEMFAPPFRNLKINDAIIGEYNKKRNIYKTSRLNEEVDSRSMVNLRKYQNNEKCRDFLETQKIHPVLFESTKADSTEELSVTGLSCSNQSLNFIALNSLLYYNYAERLGVDLWSKKDKSAVVIVNEKLESHYIMEGPVTSKNIKKFIIDFTNTILSRSTKSSIDVASNNSHSYQRENKPTEHQLIYVDELNSNNFLETVLNKNKSIILMYYSKQCSYCNGISYVFLSLARKLSFVRNLKFARIDGDINVLPWEYTMEVYPTILFFPTLQKEETRVYPADLPINLSNLLGFVLANLDPVTKLNAMYSLCLHYQFGKDKVTCFSAVRNNTVTVIEQTLKEWRKSDNRRRQFILYNLRQLKQLQFLFTHNQENFRLVETYFNKLNTQNRINNYSGKSSGNLNSES